MQMLCGEPQAGGAAGTSAARRPCGARECRPAQQVECAVRRTGSGGRRSSRWIRACAEARETKSGAGGGAANGASATHERGGLLVKAANPELAALIRHAGLRGRLRSSGQGAAVEQTGHQKQRDHGDAEAQLGQARTPATKKPCA